MTKAKEQISPTGTRSKAAGRLQHAREGARGRDSAQPPGDAGIASPAPVSQASGAFGGEPTRPDMAARIELSCKAVCEAHALADLVRDQIDESGNGPALRFMLRRIQALSCIVLSALDDDVETLERLRERMEAA